jgi:hypothetical protein
MMGDAFAQRSRRLCGAYIQATVNESRVHADDLDGGFAGKTNGPITLAHPCRPCQNKNRQLTP